MVRSEYSTNTTGEIQNLISKIISDEGGPNYGLKDVTKPEILFKRQATQHDCLPSLLSDGDKGIKIVYGKKKDIFCTGPTRAASAEQKSLVPARRAQRTNQGGTPLICTL